MRHLFTTCVLLAACRAPEPTAPEADADTDADTDTDTDADTDAVVAIAAGEAHSVLLTAAGALFVTGDNSWGQLCTGDASGAAEWSQVAIDAVITAVEAGSRGTHLLLDGGEALACGANWGGALGIDSPATTQHDTPTPMAVTGVVALRIGASHGFALDGSGSLWAFGGNLFGQVGDGDTWDVDTPRVPIGFEALDVIAADAATAGGHSAAVVAGGDVYTWGRNEDDELGNPDAGSIETQPLLLPSVSDATDVAVGGSHALALRSDGTVWAWGSNLSGQLGRGTTGYGELPAPVSDLSDVVAIDAGDAFSIALDGEGRVWVWGYNGRGQLARDPDATSYEALVPEQVPGLPPITSIVAGSSHVLAIDTTGHAWGWGLMLDGQLGVPPDGAFWPEAPIEVF